MRTKVQRVNFYEWLKDAGYSIVLLESKDSGECCAALKGLSYRSKTGEVLAVESTGATASDAIHQIAEDIFLGVHRQRYCVTIGDTVLATPIPAFEAPKKKDAKTYAETVKKVLALDSI